MSFTLTLLFFLKYGDFESCLKAELLSPVKKTKREESSKAEAAKRQKVLDGRDVDKIKEDQHQLNTKKRAGYGPYQF